MVRTLSSKIISICSPLAIGVVILVCPAGSLLGQSDSALYRDNVYKEGNYTLCQNEDSLTSISSFLPLPVEKSPGAITVLDQEDIRALGARDLADLLLHIPGFNIGLDVQGVLAVGVRGNNAGEGINLFVDGFEMNEPLYGTIPFLNRYPVDQIRRVEVIRGPGSAIYGGLGSYGVINVYTKSSDGSGHRGIFLSNQFGVGREGETRLNNSMSLTTSNSDTHFGIVAGFNRAIGGQGIYRDYTGKCFEVSKGNQYSDNYMDMNILKKGLQFKLLFNKYATRNQDNFQLVSSKPYRLDFYTNQAILRYTFNETRYYKLTAFADYAFHRPWKSKEEIVPADSGIVIPYDKSSTRVRVGLESQVKVTPSINLFFGLTQKVEKATSHSTDNLFLDSQTSLRLNSFSVYGQGHYANPIANILVSVRFEKPNLFHAVLAPRVSAQRRIGPANLKIGYTKAYRAPTFENYNLSYQHRIQPQNCTSLDGEVAIQVMRGTEAVLNAFTSNTKSGIVYFTEDANEEGYQNAGFFGTKGIELGLKRRSRLFSIAAWYSYYTTKGMATYSAFAVPGKNVNLAFPSHKATVSSTLKAGQNLVFNVNAALIGSRYSSWVDTAGSFSEYRKHKPVLLVNLLAELKLPITPGLKIALGLKDVLNQGFDYIQPYTSKHLPLPGLRRELTFRVTYELSNRYP